MSTDEGTDLAPGHPESTAPATGPGTASSTTPRRRSTRRARSGRLLDSSHPVVTPLAGFFTGTALVVVVLGGLGVVLSALFDVEISEHPGPFLVAILGLFVLNVLLLVAPGTRRFARYMLFGLVTTPLVVAAVAALTLFVLVRTDG